MNEKPINTTELQLVEIIIKNSVKKIETHHLESHLYKMFDGDKYEDVRPITEELLACVNAYFYASEELDVNLDFKRGMNELNFWCMCLAKRLNGREDAECKVAVELLLGLMNDINSCELLMNDNLAQLGFVV
jgi:hypothetical protein